jgi:integrase
MSRPNKIWFRKDIGWWMVTLGGEKIRLSQGRQNKKLAHQKFHELAAVRPQAPQSPAARVADIIEKFLACNRSLLSDETMRNYDWYGQAFAEHSGYLVAIELKPHHVTDFVSKDGWGTTTQYNARRTLFRIFSWAAEEGLLPHNPLKGMKRPKPAPRSRAMKEEEFRSLLRGETKARFKAFLFALWATGCRPKEARTLKWTQVRDDRWVLEEHKTVHKTRKPRIIYLNGPMRKLMGVLRRQATTDYVFVNLKGTPWTRDALRQRIMRIKAKLGLAKDVCAYLLRHAFGTNAIVNGVDVATVAELMGHTSLEMVSTVYLHLADQHKHLQGAVERATGYPAAARHRQGGVRSTA